jgi:peptide-methionine (S)-S-oxide reductase
MTQATQTATFAGGCFWCLEAVFDALQGVTDVQSGYSGGHKSEPTYKEVCNGDTGHAEVVHIAFNPQEISFDELLEVFFVMHDPTQLNRQGNDVGTQYRSAVFYHSPDQKAATEAAIARIGAEGLWSGKVVTQVVPFERFWPAEDYHRDYFAHNPEQPYSDAVVGPKVAKFRQKFASRLKG